MIIIDGKALDTTVLEILEDLKRETGYVKDVKKSSNSILVTCPFHAEGREKHPSCGLITDPESPREGVYHCFTCGEKGPIFRFVAKCFNRDDSFGKEWLQQHYANIFTERRVNLPEITLGGEPSHYYLDESILDQYSYFHPYMFRRGLTEDIIRTFRIGYNEKTESITFPVWDANDRLVLITERSVKNKHFHIPETDCKPVYLLNYIIKHNIKEVVVCESQINALTCWTWGIPAIALLGTGSDKQYEILRKSGIRNYHLALDGDMAGYHGTLRFIKNMPESVLIDVISIPTGKDINDLQESEFHNLERIDRNNFTKGLISK